MTITKSRCYKNYRLANPQKYFDSQPQQIYLFNLLYLIIAIVYQEEMIEATP
jgi:hypothetical protein